MKNFQCSCGQALYFENTCCLSCNEQVAFDPITFQMGPIADQQRCKNGLDYNVCNWLVTESNTNFCISCGLNHTIPNLLLPNRRKWWKSLEIAKRRLIYSLLWLKLPVVSKQESDGGLGFRFIEDKRSNPGVFEEHVTTGHYDGMITINITEADHVRREITRQFSGELYRTLLGHFRHESGHYYFHALVQQGGQIEKFREMFGDERQDYAAALEYYYANKFTMVLDHDLVSHYAQAHPYEDWAEVWAHYLHMLDTLDTAGEYNMQQGSSYSDDINRLLLKWAELTEMMNALNRSMGLEDAYPFILSEKTQAKLHFVHDLIYPS